MASLFFGSVVPHMLAAGTTGTFFLHLFVACGGDMLVLEYLVLDAF